jgi:hypothetical protein
MMSEPHDYQSFLDRFHRNVQAVRCDVHSGLGLPCPFCGAKYFTFYPIFHAGVQLVMGCRECHRQGYFCFEPFDEHGNRTFYIIQTGGPKQPSWFYPRIGWVN